MVILETNILIGEQSKKTIFSYIIRQFCQYHADFDEHILFEQFWQREMLGSTGIGHGIAIPHVRVDGIDKTLGVLVKIENPIDFAGMDKQPVDIILGMLFPSQDPDRNLVELKKVCAFFNSSQNRQRTREISHVTDLEKVSQALLADPAITDESSA